MILGSGGFALGFWFDFVAEAETWATALFMATGIAVAGGFLILIALEIGIELVRATWQSWRIARRSIANAKAVGRKPERGQFGAFLRLFRGEFFSSHDWVTLPNGGRFYHVPWREKAMPARKQAEWDREEAWTSAHEAIQ